MSKATYPLKLPASIKAAAARLAKEDGVSLNQWITAAVAQKIGAVETAAEFIKCRAGNARPEDLKAFLGRPTRAWRRDSRPSSRYIGAHVGTRVIARVSQLSAGPVARGELGIRRRARAAGRRRGDEPCRGCGQGVRPHHRFGMPGRTA